MVIVAIVILIVISYAVAFIKDIPDVLLKRTGLFFLILLLILNHKIVVGLISGMIRDIIKAGGM